MNPEQRHNSGSDFMLNREFKESAEMKEGQSEQRRQLLRERFPNVIKTLELQYGIYQVAEKEKVGDDDDQEKHSNHLALLRAIMCDLEKADTKSAKIFLMEVLMGIAERFTNIPPQVQEDSLPSRDRLVGIGREMSQLISGLQELEKNQPTPIEKKQGRLLNDIFDEVSLKI